MCSASLRHFEMVVCCAALAGVVVQLVGCGGSTDQTSLAHSNEQTVLPASAPSELTDGEKGAPAKTPSGDTAADSTRQSGTQAVPQVLQPTADQLARWARQEFAPLQMLACRQASDIGFVASMAHTPDGRHFMLAGATVSLWTVGGDAPEQIVLEFDGGEEVKSLATAPNGQWFAAGDSEGTLRIWSVADRQELISKQLSNNDIVDIAISPDSQQIATIGYDNQVTTWSADQLQQLNRFQIDTNNVSRILYMSPELLVAAGETTSSWNVATGKVEHLLSRGRYNYALCRSPDNNRFVFGDEEGLQFWNIGDAKRNGTLAAGFATRELIVFSPDGQLLATANGNSIRIWDIAQSQLVQMIDTFGWPIVGLSWLPESNLLVVASENGRIRLWGTEEAGATAGLQPMHAAVAMPQPGKQQSATPAQLEQMLDLRIFPRLAGKSVTVGNRFDLMYTSSVSVTEALLFYRHQLGQDGWQEVSGKTTTPNTIAFSKLGCTISVSCHEAGAAETTISVNFAGNYDLQWVPKFDAAPIETTFENADVVMYRTKADLVQIETSLLRQLHKEGWTAYSRLHASHSETEDNRSLSFLRDGLELNVSIGRFPADPTSYTVQYSRSLETNTLPVPPDSGFVEFDSSTQPQLVATTAMNLDQTHEYYDQQLTKQGWLVRQVGRNEKDNRRWLSYVRGQRDLMIGLQQKKSGGTLILVGEKLENASWQYQDLLPQEPADEQTAGMEAADFPILNASKSAKFDSIGKQLDFAMGETPLPEVAEQYTEALQTADWQLDGAGIKSDDYVYLTFTKDDTEIQLRARLTDGQATVNVQGDGLLWNKPLPGGQPVISYETWLRINHHPGTLTLLDNYAAEMQALAADSKSK